MRREGEEQEEEEGGRGRAIYSQPGGREREFVIQVWVVPL